MRVEELEISSLGRAALLWAPDRGVRPRGAIVALRGAALPQRRQPLFEHLATTLTPLYLPRTLLGPDDAWPDMDYDPEPAFSRVQCPVLLVYGADEECVPAEASKSVWLRASPPSAGSQPTIVDLPDCGHFPAPGGDGASLDVPVSAFSPTYTTALQQWATSVVT